MFSGTIKIIYIFLIATLLGNHSLPGRENVKSKQNEFHFAFENIPKKYSLSLVRDITQIKEGKKHYGRSLVKFFYDHPKWRFELWVGSENKESLDVIQIYDGETYFYGIRPKDLLD